VCNNTVKDHIYTCCYTCLTSATLGAGCFLAIAVLSLVAHNLYLGVLIFQHLTAHLKKLLLSGQMCLQPLQQSAWNIMII
jgi:hypothetical protein